MDPSWEQNTLPTNVFATPLVPSFQVAGLLGLRQLKAAVDGPEEFQLQPGSLQGKNVLITGPRFWWLEGGRKMVEKPVGGASFCMFVFSCFTINNSDISPKNGMQERRKEHLLKK